MTEGDQPEATGEAEASVAPEDADSKPGEVASGQDEAGQDEAEAKAQIADPNGPAPDEPAAARVSVAERRELEPGPPPPPCPICGLAWDEHNIARVRECMAPLEEALALAEKARIRASLTLPESALDHGSEQVDAAPQPDRPGEREAKS